LSLETYQKASTLLKQFYAARARMLPREYTIANLAGLPVATLRIAPNENI